MVVGDGFRAQTRPAEKNRSQRGKGAFGPDAFDAGRWVSKSVVRSSDSGFPESSQQVTVASTGRPSEGPSLRVLGSMAVAAGESAHGAGGQSEARQGLASARVSGDGGGAERSWRRSGSGSAGERGRTLRASRARRRTLREAARGSRDPGAAACTGVAAAAEVLSAPRKWPKGSGWEPFKGQPRPLGAPRPAPRPRPARAARAEVGAASLEPERRGGRAGRADTGGRGRGWGPQGDSGASLRMRPRPPRRPRRPRRCAGPHVRSSPRAPRPGGPRLGGGALPARSRREFPRGRVLSRRIPGMPPGRGGRSQPLRPGPTPATPPPPRKAGPQPTRAASPRPDSSGHVARAREPRLGAARRQDCGRSYHLVCPEGAPRVTRARKPQPPAHPGSRGAQSPARPEGGALPKNHDGKRKARRLY